jgi:hypothetical protein
MSTQNVSVGARFGWIGASFGLFKRHFATFIGASAIMLALVLAAMVPAGLAMYSSVARMAAASAAGGVPPLGADMGGFWLSYGLAMLVFLLGFPPMLIGWFRLCRELDQGRPARATDILAPYRDGGLWWRSLKFVLVAMALYLLVLVLVGLAFAGPFSAFMQETAAQKAAALAGAAPVQPHITAALVLGYFAFLAIALLLQFVYMVGFAEIALRPTRTLGAMRLAAAGVARNALKLFLFLFCIGLAFLVACVVAGIALGALFALLAMLQPAAAMLVGAVCYLLVLLCMYPLMFAGHYLVWKSMLGDGVAPPPPEAFDGALVA